MTLADLIARMSIAAGAMAMWLVRVDFVASPERLMKQIEAWCTPAGCPNLRNSCGWPVVLLGSRACPS